jgi:hypothetical protein
MGMETLELGPAQDAVDGIGEQAVKLVTLHSVTGLVVIHVIRHHITCL